MKRICPAFDYLVIIGFIIILFSTNVRADISINPSNQNIIVSRTSTELVPFETTITAPYGAKIKGYTLKFVDVDNPEDIGIDIAEEEIGFPYDILIIERGMSRTLTWKLKIDPDIESKIYEMMVTIVYEELGKTKYKDFSIILIVPTKSSDVDAVITKSITRGGIKNLRILPIEIPRKGKKERSASYIIEVSSDKDDIKILDAKVIWLGDVPSGVRYESSFKSDTKINGGDKKGYFWTFYVNSNAKPGDYKISLIIEVSKYGIIIVSRGNDAIEDPLLRLYIPDFYLLDNSSYIRKGDSINLFGLIILGVCLIIISIFVIKTKTGNYKDYK